MSRLARGLSVAVVLLLAVQLMVPLGVSHGGDQQSDHHEAGESSNRAGDTNDDGHLSPNAQPVTPGVRYVKQEDPAIHDALVVWQQKGLGRDWDIMAYNFSSGGDAFPITTRAVNEVNPDVHGPWVAWEERNKGTNATTDIVVFDMRTGRAIRVPDSGRDEVQPVIAAGPVVYYAIRTGSHEAVMRAFDLETRTVEQPIGNTTITGEIGAHKHEIAWAEAPRLEAKLRVMDVRTGNVTAIQGLWRLEDGPVLGRAGVAFVASIGGRQSGTYTHLWEASRGVTPLRSGVSPHQNLEQCADGVVWDQPGSSTTDVDNIAIFDTYIRKRVTLSPHNTNPDCGGGEMVFEKRVESEDEDLGRMPRIYHLDLSETRLPTRASIDINPSQEQGIFRNPVVFTGTAEPGDPREPITKVVGRVDDEPFREISFERVGSTVRWEMRVNPHDYFSGQHVIEVGVVDVDGSTTQQGFIFYTDVPYALDHDSLPKGVDVPQTEPSPFPFNLIDHYKAYQPFYNTILLALILIVGGIYAYRRYRENQPPPTPEFVRPEEY